MAGDTEEEAFDVMAHIEIVGEVRAAAKRVTGGNCSFADDDLAILEHLATRAVANGLTDRLNWSVTRRIAQSVPFAPKKVPPGQKVLTWFERAFHARYAKAIRP